MPTKVSKVDRLINVLNPSTGQPLDGAKVYVYLAGGTSIPPNTTTGVWLDALKNNAAARPMELDATGSIEVYAEGDLRYKVFPSTAVDDSGTPLYDWDDLDYESSRYLSITSTTTPFGINDNSPEDLVLADTDTLGAPMTVNLPPVANTVRPITIINTGSTHNVTVDGDGGELIDGALTDILTPGKIGIYAPTGSAWVNTITDDFLSVVNIDVYNNNLGTAITSIGATDTTLVITNNVMLDAHAVVPKNIHLWVKQEGKITLGNFNIAQNGALWSPRKQIFDHTGTGRVTFGSGSVEAIIPEWYGVVSDGNGAKTDNATTMGYATVSAAASGIRLKCDGDYYWAGTLAVVNKIDIDLNGSFVLDKTAGMLELQGAESTLNGGLVTSDVFVATVSADVNDTDLTINVEDASGFEVGDDIRSSWLYGDGTSAEILSKTATSVTVDKTAAGLGTAKLTNYFPPGFGPNLQQPAGSWIFHYNGFVPALQIKGDNCTVNGTRFYRTAGQAIRSEDAEGVRIIDVVTDETILDSIAIATSGTAASTSAQIIGGHHNGPMDIGKQGFILNGRNSKFEIQGSRIWSIATDGIIFMFTNGQNSEYIFSDLDIKNVKPFWMTSASPYTAVDFGRHPGSVFRIRFEEGLSLNAKLLRLNNVKFTNVSGDALINNFINPTSVFASSVHDRVEIIDTYAEEGIDFSPSSDTVTDFFLSNVTLISSKARVFSPGTTVNLDIDGGCVFKRIDGNYTDNNANDGSFLGVDLNASGRCVVHPGATFINGVTDKVTYSKTPFRWVSNNTIADGLIFEGGVISYAGNMHIEDAIINGVDDDITQPTAGIAFNGLHVGIKSINGGRLGAEFYREAGANDYVRRGKWEATLRGFGGDWYIPNNSVFEQLSDGALLTVTLHRITTTSAQAAAGQPNIVLTNAASVANNDWIIIEQTDGTTERYQVSSIAGAPTIVLTTNLSKIVESGAGLSAFVVA